MRPLRLLLLLALSFLPGLTRASSCQDLRALLGHDEPAFDEADKLQRRCADELQNDQDAVLVREVRAADVVGALRRAHEARLIERQEILRDLQAVSGLFHSKDVTARERAEAGFFADVLRGAELVQTRMYAVKAKPLSDYLPDGLRAILAKHVDPPDVGSQKILQAMNAKVGEFASTSDAIASGWDKRAQETLIKFISSAKLFQAQANYAAAEKTYDEILAGVEDSILALKASNAWGIFLTENNTDILFLEVEQDLAKGLTESAQDKLAALRQIMSRLKGSLGLKLSTLIDQNEAPAFNERVARLEYLAKALTPPDREKRLLAYLAYRRQAYNPRRSSCIAKYTSERGHLQALNRDLDRLDDVRSVEDPPTRLFVYSSLVEKLDIAFDLCNGVGR